MATNESRTNLTKIALLAELTDRTKLQLPLPLSALQTNIVIGVIDHSISEFDDFPIGTALAAERVLISGLPVMDSTLIG